MNTKVLLFLASLIIVGLIGYWIGAKQSQPVPAQPKLGSKPASGNVEIDKIIDLTEARDYHKALKKFLKNAQPNEIKKLFDYPIRIDDAQTDFYRIFSQDSNLGLRMYPGLRYDGTKPEITFIFIATKGDSDLVYKPGDVVQGETIKKESAMIQDNNRPCNPCKGMKFADYKD